jgi:hypothetical protein
MAIRPLKNSPRSNVQGHAKIRIGSPFCGLCDLLWLKIFAASVFLGGIPFFLRTKFTTGLRSQAATGPASKVEDKVCGFRLLESCLIFLPPSFCQKLRACCVMLAARRRAQSAERGAGSLILRWEATVGHARRRCRQRGGLRRLDVKRPHPCSS